MLRIASLFVLLGFTCPAQDEDKKVTITFLGGAKKVPLEGLKVTLRASTGDWTADLKNKVARKQASADAQLQADDFVTSSVSQYKAALARN